MKLPLIMLGAGGHARVLHALAIAADHLVIGLCDPELTAKGETHWNGIPVLGGDEALQDIDPTSTGLINGIGQLVGSQLRERIYTRMRSAGFHFPPLIHPSAWVAPDVTLDDGVQVMAGAIVQPGCSIGSNTILNTRAGVDHDCIIGAHVHVAPGATLCGGVQVDDGAFIAAGAVLIQSLHIGARAIVGAGSILTRSLPEGQTCIGAANRLKHHHIVQDASK
jgi:sugar O-acyltransferase (sialic acid O-acetyltransferase NeuD family)